jgi:hypothetical protein
MPDTLRKSRKGMISSRVARLREKVKVDTQRIRKTTLNRLEEIFNLAVSLAKADFKTQKVDGKKVKVTLKQRQIWARVAAYVAQVMNSIAAGFDERDIDVQLDKLERLVDEAQARAENAANREKTAEPKTA